MNDRARELAEALYLAAKDRKDDDARAIIARFVERLKQKGLGRMALSVLKVLPGVAAALEASDAVVIESARALGRDEVARIAASLGIAPGETVVQRVVPGMIGGVRVSKRGRVVDASIRGALQRVTRAISSR